LLAGARRLADAVRQAGPDTNVWTWADDQTALPRIDDFPALSQLRGHGQTLHFHATDPGLATAGEWLAHRTPAGVEWEHRHATADATLRGPALDLLLVMSRRAPLDTARLEASGDTDLLAHWLEHSRLEPA